jgi:bla regulator protein blaR1
MSAEVLQVLTDTTLASSVAVLLVRLLRKPMRAVVGARAAYWLWLLVPAMAVAVLLPAPSPTFLSTQVTLPEQIRSALIVAPAGESASNRAVFINSALAIWAIGACAMFVSMLARQRSFVRSLGALTRDADGLHRCDVVVAPMLVGMWHAKVVVPTDFECRYSLEERELVIAHERAHESRRDVAINAIASFALCLFWFNPLMYRALAWLRMDQELACDAQVLSLRGAGRRCYADALFKTQLATESAWQQPVGCHWQSTHPLKERIFMLKRPLPGRSRRLVGLTAIVAFTGAASYAAWAGQSATDTGPSILVDLKVTISNPQVNETKALVSQYLVRSGEEIKDANGRPLDFVCTPYLPDEPGRSTDWRDQKARGIPAPAAGQILLDCTIRRDNAVVNRPAVIVADGKSATIETAERDGSHRYRFDLTASTSAEKIAAAKKQSGK